jgi:hypothetical protein
MLMVIGLALTCVISYAEIYYLSSIENPIIACGRLVFSWVLLFAWGKCLVRFA